MLLQMNGKFQSESLSDLVFPVNLISIGPHPKFTGKDQTLKRTFQCVASLIPN